MAGQARQLWANPQLALAFTFTFSLNTIRPVSPVGVISGEPRNHDVHCLGRSPQAKKEMLLPIEEKKPTKKAIKAERLPGRRKAG
jgi:hypothetical protein